MKTMDGRPRFRGARRRDVIGVLPWIIGAAIMIAPNVNWSGPKPDHLGTASIAEWSWAPNPDPTGDRPPPANRNAAADRVLASAVSPRIDPRAETFGAPMAWPRSDPDPESTPGAGASVVRPSQDRTPDDPKSETPPSRDPFDPQRDDPFDLNSHLDELTPADDDDAIIADPPPVAGEPITVDGRAVADAPVIEADTGDASSRDESLATAAPEAKLNQAVVRTAFNGFDARVIDTSTDTELIRVRKGRTVVITTSEAVGDIEIVNPEVADVRPISGKEFAVTGVEFGGTQLVLRTPDQKRKAFDVVVELDIEMLNHVIRDTSPLSNVDARMLGGTLVLSGTVPDPTTAEKIGALARVIHPRIMNMIEVAGLQQVVLRCTVAEVSREAIRELAMNWAIGSSDWSRDVFFANNLGQLNPTVFGDNGLTDILAPSPLDQLTYNRLPTANSNAVNVSFGFPRAEFQLFMRALRDNSLLKILAEPNVVAVNGQEASFLAGGEFPTPVSQGGATAGGVTVEYKEFGIRLDFVPTIMAGGQIRMKLMAEVSDLVTSNAGTAGGLPVFSLTTRRVSSTVDCGDGQTFAVGGLLSETVQASSSKLPGLGDIPVLGALFSSVRYQRRETELVILVTPELVTPMDPHQVPPIPGGDMTSPDDAALFLNQQLEGTPREAVESDGAPRHGFPARVRPNARQSDNPAELSIHGPWGASDIEGH
jgi:pilus assembly protein CpaC